MPISCNPQDLIGNASQFCCITGETAQAVKLYLLRHIAGLDAMTPQELLAASACWMTCVPSGAYKAVEAYLLCQIANSGGGGQTCRSLSGDAPPTGSVTPDFIGQFYIDTSTNPDSLYQSTGTTSADWAHYGEKYFTAGGRTLVGDTTTTSYTYQGEQLNSGLFLASNTALLSFDAPHLTQLSNNSVSFSTGFGLLVLGNSALVSVSCPNLISVTSTAFRGTLNITSNAALVSLNFDALTSIEGDCTIISNATLAAISLPSLVSVGAVASGFLLTGNTLLASLSLPSLVTSSFALNASGLANLTTVVLTSYLPSNTRAQNFGGCALTQASVDHILARCVANAAYVSGTVTLNGGTNATPSAQGLLDKATLIGRGCTVTTN